MSTLIHKCDEKRKYNFSEFNSPPASVSHEKSSSSSFPSPFQHPSPNGQTSYYSGQSHYEHPNPNANAAVSSAPAHVPPPPPPPSMSRAAAASPPSPSSPSAPLPGPSSYDSSAHHAPPLATDHDLSHIVDQGSILKSFPHSIFDFVNIFCQYYSNIDCFQHELANNTERKQ